MKIVYLASEPRIEMSKPVGHTTHIAKTINGLRKRDHYVNTLIAGENKGAQRAKSSFKRMKTKLPSSVSLILRDVYALFHDRTFFRHCYSVCHGKRYDFIYERSTAYHRTGQRLSKALRIPLVLEVNSPIEEMINYHGCSKLMIPIVSYWETSVASQAHAIVAGSAAMREYLVQRGVESDKIFIIYPTAEDHFFKPTTGRASIRLRYGIDDKVVVGFVGSMAPFHGVDLLLKAAMEVRRVRDDVHLLIVGDGKMMSSLKTFVKQNSLDKTVTLTGRATYGEVPDYCAAMDFCVIPNATWYGSPTKLFEYAACGKAVIGPRLGPIQELIRDGENGMLAEVGNVKDLANRILALAADPALAYRLAMELQQEVLRNHTWDRNTEKLMNIYNCIRTNGASSSSWSQE